MNDFAWLLSETMQRQYYVWIAILCSYFDQKLKIIFIHF